MGRGASRQSVHPKRDKHESSQGCEKGGGHKTAAHGEFHEMFTLPAANEGQTSQKK
jgi:hypothetical protein